MYWIRTLWSELYDAIEAIVNVIVLWLFGQTADYGTEAYSDSSFTYDVAAQYPYAHNHNGGCC